LTREPSGNDVGDSAPGFSVKRLDISENRKPGKTTVFLPLTKDLLAMEIDFDGCDDLVIGERIGKNSSASACK
jgi:hypothetical protein